MPSTHEKGQAASKLHLPAIVPFVLIAIVLLAAVVILIWHHVSRQHAVQQERASNLQLGIPADYPSHLVPVYPGVKIVESKRDTAKSTDGAPMDMWHIHATSTDSVEQLHDYYMDIVAKLDLSQTMGMQIPTGYGFNYANEDMIAEFVVETRAPDPLTHLEIKLYLVK